MDLVQVGQNYYQTQVENQRWQAEIVHRARESRWRRLDDLRRSVDERVEQLKAISEISALIAGFAMVTMVEVSIPESLDTFILVGTGVVASGVIGCMLYVMISSIFLLLICYDLIKSDTRNKQVTEYNLPRDEVIRGKRLNHFEVMWQRYKDQWALVVQVFVGGCLLFPMLIALTSWIVFWEHRSRDFAGGAVTLIAGISFFFLARRFAADHNYINAADRSHTSAMDDEHGGEGMSLMDMTNFATNYAFSPSKREHEDARRRDGGGGLNGHNGHVPVAPVDDSNLTNDNDDGVDEERQRVFADKLEQARALVEELKLLLEEGHQVPPVEYIRHVDQQIEVGALEQDLEVVQTDARNCHLS